MYLYFMTTLFNLKSKERDMKSYSTMLLEKRALRNLAWGAAVIASAAIMTWLEFSAPVVLTFSVLPGLATVLIKRAYPGLFPTDTNTINPASEVCILSNKSQKKTASYLGYVG